MWAEDPLPPQQAGVGPRASALLIQCLLSLVLFLCPCLVPVAPSVFPLSQFYPPSLSSIQSVGRKPKRLCFGELQPGTEWHL